MQIDARLTLDTFPTLRFDTVYTQLSNLLCPALALMTETS
jgi:hypothetical protein